MTEDRIFRKVAEGKDINISVTPTLRAENHGMAVEQVEVQLFNGILGLRKLVIRAGDDERFSKINHFSDLRSMTVGQGMQWMDVSIFRHSDINVVESFSFHALFPMLAAERFDFVSLGIVEIDDALEKQKTHAGDLVVHDDIYIYYPFPVYLSINSRDKNLVDRIKYGSEKLVKSGTLQRNFEKFFTAYIKKIYYADAKVFVLENPTLSESVNQQSINHALNVYFSNKSHVYFGDGLDEVFSKTLLQR